MNEQLIFLEDNQAFGLRLKKSLEQYDFDVHYVSCLKQFQKDLDAFTPTHAILDLKLDDGSGLDALNDLQKKHPTCRTIILTGYANIATAVSAVKHGAIDYLPKPVDVDFLVQTLRGQNRQEAEIATTPLSPDRVKWEHIQRVFEECGRNVSQTARTLKMHRRSLQRILSKYAPKE